MPKINVYLPDDLAEAVKEFRVPVSAVCQQALQQAVGRLRSAKEPRRGSNFFNYFTEEAKSIVVVAQERARERNDHEVDVHHLLLAILDIEDGLAVQALNALDVSVEAIRAAVDETAPRGKTPYPHQHMPFTRQAKSVLQGATREMLEMRDDVVNGEHLLLAILHEDDSPAGKLLGSLGVDAALRRQVRMLRSRTSQSADPEGGGLDRFGEVVMGRLDDLTSSMDTLAQHVREHAIHLQSQIDMLRGGLAEHGITVAAPPGPDGEES